MKTKSKKAVKKNPSGQRVEFWRTYMNTWNYRLIAENGEILFATNQNYDTKAMLQKSIKAVAEAFGGDYKKVPQYEVPPKRKPKTP